MSMVATALESLASIVGIWTAVSLVVTPAWVICMQVQSRAQDRWASELRRQAWFAAVRGT